MEADKQVQHVNIECPYCNGINSCPTRFEGKEVHQQSSVPTQIAIDMIGWQVECAACQKVSAIGGTHPHFITINLYELESETND